jgi:hypothetical protein
MRAGILAIAAAGLAAVAASWFMWWATKRSAAWAMAAGSLMALIALLGAVLIAWVLTRATFGP